jgi:hypothetical protein
VRSTRIRAQRRLPRFTHLAACVSEEDGGFTVQVRLYHQAKSKNRAWGEEIADSFEEEIADSFETASAMLGDLAAAYSIPQTHITISVLMENARGGTRH